MTQSVLITGVGKRLGLAMAKHFAKHNYQVFGTYRSDRPSLVDLNELGVHLVRCDLQNKQDLDELCVHIKQNTAELRAIVHNASDWQAEKEMSDQWTSFEQMMTVHAKAPYYLNLQLETLLCDGADIVHTLPLIHMPLSRSSYSSV